MPPTQFVMYQQGTKLYYLFTYSYSFICILLIHIEIGYRICHG
jgi:hypothetical protein